MSSARDRALLILVLLVSLFIAGGCGSQGGDNASSPQPPPGAIPPSPVPPVPVTPTPPPTPPPVATPPDAASPRWTILVYMVADNNLESAAIEDLNEMLDIPSTARVNVVVQADRGTPADGNSDEAVGGIPDWTSTKRLLVNHGSLTELEDLGELNMGSPRVLEDFLVWGATRFPADRHAVIFWDHGSSWPGFGQDETDGNDVLSLAELKQALTDARLPRFDLIGFDSCLMANLEVAAALRGFGKVLVASEEIEPGHGWDYAAILGGLAANTAMSESDLGRLITDSYKAHAEAYGQNARTQGEAYNQERAVTLSVIDLSRIALLMETLDEFATTLHGKIGVESLISRPTWLGVAQARTTSEEYGVDPKGGATNDVTDLANFVDRVKQQVLDPTVVLQADSVLATLRGAMIYAINSVDRPHAAGLSVYFPSRQDLNPDYLTSLPLSPVWESFLTSFNDLRVIDGAGPILTGATVVGTDTAGHAVIGATVAGDDVDTVQAFVIQQAGSQIILLGSVDVPVSSGVAAVTWDGRWPRLCSGGTCQFAPFETIDDLEGNGVLLNIPAVYRPTGSTRDREVNLLFEYDTVQQTGTFLGAWPGSDTGLATKEVIALKTGDTITPYFETYDVLTDQTGFQLATPLVVTSQGVTLADAPLPADETFLIGFIATDTSGNEAVTDTLISCVGTVCQSGGSVANVWTTKASMPTPGWCLASASVNGKIYVVNWGWGALTEYDPVTDRWTSRTPMPVSAMCSRAEAVNDKMYVMGGHSSSQTFQTVMAYDPLTDSWSNKAPMQRPRSEFASAVIDGKIYVMGGVSGNQITNSVEVYDPVADTWASKAPMATARVDFSASAVNGKIYAVSGDGSPCAVSTVEEYDPSSDHWTSRSPLPTARCGLATSAVNGKLYAIGGYGSAPPAFSTVEEYDPITNHWTSKASIPTARAQLTVAEIGGRIYAVGGTTDLLPRGVATVEEFRP